MEFEDQLVHVTTSPTRAHLGVHELVVGAGGQQEATLCVGELTVVDLLLVLVLKHPHQSPTLHVPHLGRRHSRDARPTQKPNPAPSRYSTQILNKLRLILAQCIHAKQTEMHVSVLCRDNEVK